MSGNPAGLNILAGIWVPTGTAGLVLILRVYCKHVRERGMWWDDAVFIVSWVCHDGERSQVPCPEGLLRLT